MQAPDSKSLSDHLAQEFLTEKRRDRRWRNLRSFIWLAVIIIYGYFLFDFDTPSTTLKGPYVSLVRLNGIIMPGTPFSAQKVIPMLDAAFADHNAKGVVIVINSPGGSPVQASIIHDRIMTLKARYHKKVAVVGEDSLASGAYLVATAADKIFVNRDTLTGSIGVIYSGFGFVDAMTKLGVSRRVYTAGEHKDRLDPFEKADPADIEKLKSVMASVHQSFINDVIQGRGSRLKGDQKTLFSGDFWSGSQAVALGLADGTANVWEVVKQEFGAKSMKNYTPRPSLLNDIANNLGSELHLMHDAPVKTQAF